MRITRDQLLKIARDHALRMISEQEQLVCVYLTGSLLDDEPFLGGTTDIDLIMVHASDPPVAREVIPYSDEVHFDISHLSQALFSQPRNLRGDPWIGSFFCLNPRVLYDTRHWFEFTQASICSQFDLPDHVHNRANTLAAAARDRWLLADAGDEASELDRLCSYLNILENAANAIACLSGAPLTKRRLLLNFEERAEAVGRPGLYAGLLDLLGADEMDSGKIKPWLEGWKATLEDATHAENCPPSLSAPRLLYFTEAVDAMVDDHPQSGLWLLLNTWTRALQVLGEGHPSYLSWRGLCHELGLGIEDGGKQRQALDVYLDSVEETIESWARDHYLLS